MRLRALKQRLRKKAIQSSSRYKIAAAAFTKHGNLLGYATNNVNMNFPSSRKGGGLHAERELMKEQIANSKTMGLLNSILGAGAFAAAMFA